MIELFPALGGGLFLMVLGWVDRSRFFPMMTVAQFPWRPPSPWRPTSEWRTLPHLGHNMGGGFFSFSLAKSWDLWPNTSSSTCKLTAAKKRRETVRNGEKKRRKETEKAAICAGLGPPPRARVRHFLKLSKGDGAANDLAT